MGFSTVQDARKVLYRRTKVSLEASTRLFRSIVNAVQASLRLWNGVISDSACADLIAAYSLVLSSLWPFQKAEWSLDESSDSTRQGRRSAHRSVIPIQSAQSSIR